MEVLVTGQQACFSMSLQISPGEVREKVGRMGMGGKGKHKGVGKGKQWGIVDNEGSVEDWDGMMISTMISDNDGLQYVVSVS